MNDEGVNERVRERRTHNNLYWFPSQIESTPVPLFPREFTIITKITIRCSSTQAQDFLAQVTQDLRLPALSHTRQRDFLALITQDQRLPCSDHTRSKTSLLKHTSLRLPALSHTRQRDFLALITQDQRLPCSSTQAQDFMLKSLRLRLMCFYTKQKTFLLLH